MEALEAIKKRYSYRGAYRKVTIPAADLKTVIEAGISAPSGCNRQTTSFIAVDNPGLVESIMDLIRENGFSGGSPSAGICVLTRRVPAYGDYYFNVQDYAAAIENMLIAAAALGYASCWLEGQVTEKAGTQEMISKLLGVPSEYTVVAFLPIGIPENESRRPGYKPFPERAWLNSFGNNF